MTATRDKDLSLAVLIDADNASPSILAGLLAEVARLGIASVKRIYGDWTTPRLAQWKAVLLEHSVQPIQQFSYTSGKNATDTAMIIDAMDLLYTGRLDGFCLVSSDSDFTRLAARIRESGLRVYGFGEEKTPKAFVAACDRFIYTQVLMARPDGEVEAPRSPTPSKTLRGNTALIGLVRAGVEAASDEEGWATLSAVGSYLNRTVNDFDPRNYGYTKLSDLVKAIDLFELTRRQNHFVVKDARQRTSSAKRKV